MRAGFVRHLRREVLKALKPHHADECPFVDLPNPKSSRWGGGVEVVAQGRNRTTDTRILNGRCAQIAHNVVVDERHI